MDLRAHAQTLLSGIYVIVNSGPRDAVGLARDALAGGARIVQYRAKGGIVPEHARAMRELTRGYGALFLLNDDWRSVALYDADGAHVGPEDAQAEELRDIRAALGSRLLGVSCGTPEEARHAQSCGADYIGVGAVYATGSKADAGDPIGVEGLQRAAGVTHLPVAAIGGITLERIPEIRASGVAMAAVISAVSAHPDARAATAALVRAWNG